MNNPKRGLWAFSGNMSDYIFIIFLVVTKSFDLMVMKYAPFRKVRKSIWCEVPSISKLETQIAAFVDYCNNHRYHESLENVTQADVYWGRKEEILERRQRIRNRTLLKRRMDFELQKAVLNE